MTTTRPLRVEIALEGAVGRLVLDRPPGNILDAEMIGALTAAVGDLAARPELRALWIEGAGSHFSFGASVEEHLPRQVGQMLRGFHDLFRALIDASLPVIAVVRGQCLGGGLELAAFAQRVFAARDARLGQPEIRLGVFAPAASVLLPRRVGQPRADHLLLSGEILKADAALAAGLVDEVQDDPAQAAEAWVRRWLLDKSAASLRLATAAARWDFHASFRRAIEEVETLYLERLMRLEDPVAGLEAFLAKKTPVWNHR
jgi:cyclohexa-1,5-dienecarbonyl-CoA hydratase